MLLRGRKKRRKGGDEGRKKLRTWDKWGGAEEEEKNKN
jgi:hypothetical protein